MTIVSTALVDFNASMTTGVVKSIVNMTLGRRRDILSRECGGSRRRPTLSQDWSARANG